MSLVVAEMSEAIKVVEYKLGIVFPKDLNKPRWGLVNSNYYTETEDHEGTVATVPLFHIPAGAPNFTFNIQISGARFTKKMVDNPKEVLLDCLPKGKCPLTYVTHEDQQSVQIKWAGSDILRDVPWGRWILRFLIEREGVKGAESTYFGFTTMSDVGRREVLQRLAKEGLAATNRETAEDAVKSPVSVSADVECKLTLDVKFEADRRPRFPTLFNQELADQHLPEGVYLEPMFVVRKSEVFMDFDFQSSSGLFSAAIPDQCNPVIGNLGDFAVALAWEGVQETNPRRGCIAMGLSGSWRSPQDEVSKKNTARIRWFEPDRKPGLKDDISIASFFFRDVKFLTSTAGDGVLVDPTIVYEEDKAPGG